jgi:hypothetical protein
MFLPVAVVAFDTAVQPEIRDTRISSASGLLTSNWCNTAVLTLVYEQVPPQVCLPRRSRAARSRQRRHRRDPEQHSPVRGKVAVVWFPPI